MLILTRKPGQTIQVGDKIVLQVIATRGSQVKLGLLAPEQVKILRGELVEKEKPAAA